MRRRTLVLFACGLAVLLWGVASLQLVFLREKRDALADLDARRGLLREFARRELDDRLRARLDEARPRIEAALADPLVDDGAIARIESGTVRLPRTPEFRTDASDTSAASPEGDDVLDERVAIAGRFHAALKKKDDRALEAAVRDFLAHRARYVIAATKDIPITLEMLETLAAERRPDPRLLTSLLRDGLAIDGELKQPGLQRQLLERRSRFSQSAFDALATRIAALADRAGVPADDFRARAADTEGPPSFPETVADPMLAAGGAWYLAPASGRVVEGVRVEVPGELSSIADAMRRRGLLGNEDALTVDVRDGSLASLPLEVDSPRWAASLASIRRRWALKSVLGFVLGGLAIAVAAMGATIASRERRFLALKTDFVATVSHELRTPIASLRLLAETLEKKLGRHPDARDYPARMLADVDSLSFMVENILSFHRLDRGGWKPSVRELPLTEIVQWLEREHHGVTVRARVDGVVLDADPDLVRLLFSNLASNARKYNERSLVEIEIVADGKTVRFKDNGIGIAETDRESVFAEFYRSPGATRTTRGFGLGLAICKRIMALHGGDIRIADSGPSGTSFEMVFPA